MSSDVRQLHGNYRRPRVRPDGFVIRLRLLPVIARVFYQLVFNFLETNSLNSVDVPLIN